MPEITIDPISYTPAGWPYLPDNAAVADAPAYSRALAAGLDGFTPGAGAPVQDTGWIDAGTPQGGVTGTFQYRTIAGVVWLRGSITVTLAANTSTKVLTSLPGIPAAPQRAVASTSGGTLWATLTASGEMYFRSAAAGAVTVKLDSFGPILTL